jgi:hypothetical protein
LLAIPGGNQIKLISLSEPDEVELGYREAVARFDARWHTEQAKQFEETRVWYAAAFHRGQLAEHEPRSADAWQKLEAACARLATWHLSFQACDRVLGQDPTLAPVYFRRARLRAHLFQFHEATVDQLAGLALAARK